MSWAMRGGLLVMLVALMSFALVPGDGPEESDEMETVGWSGGPSLEGRTEPVRSELTVDQEDAPILESPSGFPDGTGDVDAGAPLPVDCADCAGADSVSVPLSASAAQESRGDVDGVSASATGSADASGSAATSNGTVSGAPSPNATVLADGNVSASVSSASAHRSVLLSETWPDEWPVGWEQQSIFGASVPWAPDGALQLSFYPSIQLQGVPRTTGIGREVDIAVTDATEIWFDVLVAEEDVPAECAQGCEWYPVSFDLLVTTPDGEETVSFPYTTMDRPAGGHRTVEEDVWYRAERFRIREALPAAERITAIRIRLGGVSARMSTDNLFIIEPAGDGGEGRDLEVTALSAPTWLMEGVQVENTFHVNTTVRNTGGEAATGWSVRYLLSRDALPSEGDILLGDFAPTAPLGPGSIEQRVRVGVPEGTPAGFYKLIAVADPDGTVEETDETDNVAVLTDEVFIASRTLDPGYAPPRTAASVELRVAEGFPLDHNYVFECVPEGFTPTRYSFGFGHGTDAARPVFDVYHTFPGNGTYTVECMASDGTNTASDTLTVAVETPHPPTFAGTSRAEPESKVHGNGKWGIIMGSEYLGDGIVRATCVDVGYDDSHGPHWITEGGEVVERSGEEIRIRYGAPGTYEIVCSAGMHEGYQWDPYYHFSPRIYHTENNCCTGYGGPILVEVPDEAEPGAELLIDPLFPQDNNYVFVCDTQGFTPTSYAWDLGDGTTVTRPVEDIYHTYDTTGGEFTVSCTASDGETTVSDSIAVDVSSPLRPRAGDATQLEATLTVERLGNRTVRYTCEPVGFANPVVDHWNLVGHNETDYWLVEHLRHTDHTIEHTYAEAGEYEATCSIVVDDARYHPDYYDHASERYHTTDWCDPSCQAGVTSTRTAIP